MLPSDVATRQQEARRIAFSIAVLERKIPTLRCRSSILRFERQIEALRARSVAVPQSLSPPRGRSLRSASNGRDGGTHGTARLSRRIGTPPPKSTGVPGVLPAVEVPEPAGSVGLEIGRVEEVVRS